MPSITINGVTCDFVPGQMIMQVANAHGITIPQYCYHDGLSIVASCRICLGECWAPNPKTGKVEPYMGGKLLPTCQTAAIDGMVVSTDSPKSVQNQKAVMEYLLINHPLDCPVCDQAGECFLQDYSYEYGRGVSRFEEQKVKQPKKDLGPHIYLYADRCIMCSRCVRFTREVTGTNEMMILGRGNMEEIDVFPGRPIDNELSANVADLCPVGALLDKDFLFVQRVWFLKETPSIDPITASGDNISIHHNDGKIYRVKPRTNMSVNRWWITDEVRYGWKFVHSPDRLKTPMRRQFGILVESEWNRAYHEAVDGLLGATEIGGRLAVMVSPMLSCEEAFALANLARAIDPEARLAIGPIPFKGEDKVYPPNLKADDPKAFRVYAEKAPNARGVRRVLEAVAAKGEDAAAKKILSYEELLTALKRDLEKDDAISAVILTGNYPDGTWAGDELPGLLSRAKSEGRRFVVLIDTLQSRLVDEADIVLPGATWAEKSGTFQNARNMLQAFEAAIPCQEQAKPEGQIALELLSGASEGEVRSQIFNAADVRSQMAAAHPSLAAFGTDVKAPVSAIQQEAEMQVVEL
jgi:NADH-quinone oxidoreductase subunit G